MGLQSILVGTFGPSFTDANSISLNPSLTNSQYVDLGNNIAFDSNQSFSISCWLNLTDNKTNTGGIFGKIASSVGFVVQLQSPGNVLHIIMSDSGGGTLHLSATSAVFLMSEWAHLGISYNGGMAPSSFVVEINGFSVAMTTVTNTLTGSILNGADSYIGYNSNSNDCFSGLIDEVAIFNGTALTLVQLQAIAGSGTPTNLTGMAGLTNYYHFDGNALDSVGGINGTLVGSPAYSTNVPTGFGFNLLPVWDINYGAPYASVGGGAGSFSIGIQFNSSVSGFVHAARFFKTVSMTETSRSARLYTTAGVLLQTYSFTGESASGFQVSAANPFPIVGGTDYILAVDFPTAYQQSPAYNNIPLTHTNSWYAIGTGNFPNISDSPQRGVDLVFTTVP